MYIGPSAQHTERLRDIRRDGALVALGCAARLYRRSLSGVTFVGVTGSSGKTTTKDLIAAILGAELVGTRTPGNNNLPGTVARTVLHTRPTHDFSVLEVAASVPGSVRHAARIVQPRIAVVTSIGYEHRALFPTLEAVAREKGELLAALPADGTAVLNADDPRVLAMGADIRARRLTYGRCSGAMLQAREVRASWPDRLSFRLCYQDRSWTVSTRLWGQQMTSSVLAAIAVAVAMNVPLERALDTVKTLEPYPGRMSRVVQNGVTFIRDDYKAPAWSLDAPLAFLADARARRKVAVIGTVSNYAEPAEQVYRSVVARAREVADEVLLVGPASRHVPSATGSGGRGSVRALGSVRRAAEHLRSTLHDGDLVLVKGSNRTDHLLRAVLFQTDSVQCWRTACGRTQFCDTCELLHVPAATAA
jgi:UDP-N-acetylmuramoyl-tripeptide--D-alanyl-D-alanine ligase